MLWCSIYQLTSIKFVMQEKITILLTLSFYDDTKELVDIICWRNNNIKFQKESDSAGTPACCSFTKTNSIKEPEPLTYPELFFRLRYGSDHCILPFIFLDISPPPVPPPRRPAPQTTKTPFPSLFRSSNPLIIVHKPSRIPVKVSVFSISFRCGVVALESLEKNNTGWIRYVYPRACAIYSCGRVLRRSSASCSRLSHYL